MSNICDPVALYAWDDEQSPPMEPALPLPVQPYIDPLYIPPPYTRRLKETALCT